MYALNGEEKKKSAYDHVLQDAPVIQSVDETWAEGERTTHLYTGLADYLLRGIQPVAAETVGGIKKTARARAHTVL